MSFMVKALFYDRDSQGKRIHKNAQLIKNSPRDFELHLEPVSRVNPFCSEKCLESLFLQEPFDATIINAFSPDYKKAIEISRVWTELYDLPHERIILLCSKGEQDSQFGIQYVTCSGGNGHILPDDAKRIIDKLSKFYKL